MKALRWHAAGDLRLDDVEKPALMAGTAIVEVALCGLCGTDLHEFTHGPMMIREAPHPLSGARPPMTLGHEFTGTIVEMDGSAPGLDLGARVVADPCLRCGSCRACQRGDYHLCSVGGSLGLADHGALAQYVRVPLVQLHRVPDGVSDEQAALAEPLAVGLHAARRAGISAGDSVLVMGAGPIGLAALLGARACGAGAVFVSEPTPARAELARALGATRVFDPTTDDVRREVFEHTARNGPDAVIDGTGRPEAIDLGIRCLRRGGRIAIAGISASTLEIDLRQVVLYEREVVGSLGYNFDIPRVLELMAAGAIDARALITGIRDLSDAVLTIEELASPNQHVKVLINLQEQ